MKIHPIISVAQLEPGVQPILEVKEDNTATDVFEIEILLDKRVVRGVI